MNIEVRLAHTSERLEHSATIVEFFVLRKYRRHGVGQYAAQAILSAHPGRWEIKVIQENPAAFRFWQNIIKADWPGQEHAVTMNDEHWHGPVFTVTTESNNSGAVFFSHSYSRL